MPGGVDNAGSVAVLLELARSLPAEVPADVELIFLSPGAEEDHMVGAMRWLDVHRPGLGSDGPGGPVYSLNFDGAGAPGQLVLLEWFGFGRAFAPTVAAAARRAAAELGEPVRRVLLPPAQGVDAIPFVHRGIECLTLSSGSLGPAMWNVHSPIRSRASDRGHRFPSIQTWTNRNAPAATTTAPTTRIVRRIHATGSAARADPGPRDCRGPLVLHQPDRPPVPRAAITKTNPEIHQALAFREIPGVESREFNVRIRQSLKPGQKGTKKHLARYGHRLVRVRYRYDAVRRRRYTTVELIVDEKPWRPPGSSSPDDPVVALHVAWGEVELGRLVRAAGGTWDGHRRVWELRRSKAEELGLLGRVVEG